MLSDGGDRPVYGLRLSSVVPATVTGEGKVHALSNMDLAMKLHYLRGIYFFRREAVEGLTIYDLKKPMFEWLQVYFAASGRVRRSERGRPVIKCNDSGVRIVEARSEKSLDEWMMVDHHDLYNLLTYDQVIGPDIAFSPLVFIQFTWFKCGGLSVGLSWAHLLGDVVSALDFINMWGSIMAGHAPQQSPVPLPASSPEPQSLHKLSQKPLTLKMVPSVGDHWILPNCSHSKMGTHYFHVTLEQLKRLLSVHSGPHAQPFNLLSAILWKAVAKIRGDSEPKIVTVCRNSSGKREDGEILKNGTVIGRVEVGVSVAEADVSDLAKLIAEKTVCENRIIEETVSGDDGASDFIVYGGNLTLVNLDDQGRLFGLEMKGCKAVWASYSISGVGDKGVFLVLPTDYSGGGRMVTAILPENELERLRRELKDQWGIA